MVFFKFKSNNNNHVTPILLPTEERTYTRRQRLKRTISTHTLNLIQTWFDILPKDSSGKVAISLLVQRLEDVGFNDLMTQQFWNPNEYVNLDTFLDMMAKSGLIENYREVHGNFKQFNFVVVPPPATALVDENSSPSPPLRYRTSSVMDMLRHSVGGGIQKVGGVKVHPKAPIISRKETPPAYSEKITRLRRVTKVKIMAFLH